MVTDMYNDLLKQQVHYFKETEGGKEEMCEIIEKVADKKAENVLIEKIKVVMGKLNDTAEKAMEFLDVPKDQWAHYKSLL